MNSSIKALISAGQYRPLHLDRVVDNIDIPEIARDSPQMGLFYFVGKMAGLNPSQQIAVNHQSGPLLVLAGAGTGKTRVITFRIAKLISRGVAPDRILGVTFTNKAANEMQERLIKLLGKRKNKANRLISTFHSLCVRILRRHIENLGYPKKFAIYSGGDQESLARSVLREINVADTTLAPTS